MLLKTKLSMLIGYLEIQMLLIFLQNPYLLLNLIYFETNSFNQCLLMKRNDLIMEGSVRINIPTVILILFYFNIINHFFFFFNPLHSPTSYPSSPLLLLPYSFFCLVVKFIYFLVCFLFFFLFFFCFSFPFLSIPFYILLCLFLYFVTLFYCMQLL